MGHFQNPEVFLQVFPLSFFAPQPPRNLATQAIHAPNPTNEFVFSKLRFQLKFK